MTSRKRIARFDAPPEREGGDGGRFAFGHRMLGPRVGLEQLGCSAYVVPPGKCAFPYHAHSSIEEMTLILEGEGTLRHDDEEYAVGAGDVIGLPVGEAHQLHNTGTTDLRYLVISVSAKADVVHYPDSDKILAWSETLGRMRHITRAEAGVGYYDGESDATPAKTDPEER